MRINKFIESSANTIRVVMVARSTLYSCPGGDTTQIEMTAKYLRNFGVTADIVLADKKIDYDKYDLIHFFNIIRPDDILCHIKKEKPFVVSTVFVEYSEFDKSARSGLSGFLFKLLSPTQIEYLKCVARFLLKRDKIKSNYFLFRGQMKSISYIAERAKLLLPNSHNEYKRFENQLHKNFPYKKIVNAIDPNIFNEAVVEDKNFKDHILIVGRIEGLKNQLNVIKAIGGTQ